MEEYLSQNGWHFNKKMCTWAVTKLKRKNVQTGTVEKHSAMAKEDVEGLMERVGVPMPEAEGYDCVYVANELKASLWKDVLEDELRLAKCVRAVFNEPNYYPEKVFTRFYADCIGKGCVIPWSDVI